MKNVNWTLTEGRADWASVGEFVPSDTTIKKPVKYFCDYDVNETSNHPLFIGLIVGDRLPRMPPFTSVPPII